MAGIFKAYDIRGKLGEQLNPKVMENLGRSVGTLYKKVLVGSDLRHSSPELKKAFIKGFKTTGSQLLVGPDSHFGMVWYNAHLEDAVCAYITASHLSKEFNGLKIYYADGTSPGGETKKLEKIYNKSEFKKGQGEIKRIDRSEEYKDLLKNNFNVDSKIAVDFGGGAAAKNGPEIWRSISKKSKFLFHEVDPLLEARDPEPTKETLHELRKSMNNYDMGIGYDGDGDRVCFIDDKGELVLPENIVVLLAKEMNRPKIVVNVECSNVIKQALPDAKIYTVPVGHGYVTPACKEHNADFGVESSGHFVVGEYFYFDDAVLASMAAASKLKGKLSDFTKKLPKFHYKRTSFPVPEEKKAGLMKKVKQEMQKEYEVNTMDGVKVILDDAWVLIRPSQTEAKVRMTIEAKTEKKLNQLRKEFRSLIK